MKGEPYFSLQLVLPASDSGVARLSVLLDIPIPLVASTLVFSAGIRTYRLVPKRWLRAANPWNREPGEANNVSVLSEPILPFPVAPTLPESAGLERSTNAPFPFFFLGYNSKGERLVAGVVPLTEDKLYVLLIQSTHRKGWVLPKGGWESDEECVDAAIREAWEEAGIEVQIDYDLGDIAESRPPKSSKEKEPKESKEKAARRSLYRFYEATVTKEETNWPEKDKRQRQWMTFEQAKEALKDRPELQEALERSTMKR